MSFKDIIAADVHDVFLNTDEFSETHSINGTDMPCQEDSSEQIEREKRMNQHVDGLYKNQKLIYVSSADFGPLPKQGALLTYDSKKYRVVDAISEDGVYSITLEANRS